MKSISSITEKMAARILRILSTECPNALINSWTCGFVSTRSIVNDMSRMKIRMMTNETPRNKTLRFLFVRRYDSAVSYSSCANIMQSSRKSKLIAKSGKVKRISGAEMKIASLIACDSL